MTSTLHRQRIFAETALLMSSHLQTPSQGCDCELSALPRVDMINAIYANQEKNNAPTNQPNFAQPCVRLDEKTSIGGINTRTIRSNMIIN